jgi:hypothetical protein
MRYAQVRCFKASVINFTAVGTTKFLFLPGRYQMSSNGSRFIARNVVVRAVKYKEASCKFCIHSHPPIRPCEICMVETFGK